MRILLSVAGLLAISIALAGPAHAADQDLSGKWSFSTTGSWKKGVCPAGKDTKGTLKITQKGDAFTLVFLSGWVCRPAAACTFEGKVKRKEYKGGNSLTVDGEGGKVINRITFTAESRTAAAGKSDSSYTHPGGMSCKWGAKIRMTRKGKPPGQGKAPEKPRKK
jgi:hypothetical protein